MSDSKDPAETPDEPSESDAASTEESPSSLEESTAEQPSTGDEAESIPAQTPEAAADSTDTDSTEDGGESNDGEEPESAAEGENAADDKPAGEGDEDLPEHEPLTPEIVEDEAIRGDFMLRWAVILLAFLLGVREIGDTRTLVHIRTGEYLASHGFWPPSTDVFSYTAADQPWVNLNWLSDLVLAGVHGIGGAGAVSFFTGLLAAVTFYLLLSITRKDTPTWWNAICAAIALLAANLQFTALPEIVTLLGTAWVLRNLVAWQQDGQSQRLWCIVVTLIVWSNLDSRAFIGWILLAAYVSGAAIRNVLSKQEPASEEAGLSMRDAGIAVGAGLVALLLNPFGWNSILAPFALYGGELDVLVRNAGNPLDPAIVQLRSITDSFVWDHLNVYIISGFVVPGLALVTCLLNRKRLDPALLVTLIAVACLTLASTHELALAALVASVLASLNGQDWYRATFRQEYTTETLEVLWSRVGRAITVLGFATIAWLGISGRLMHPHGQRIGFGFSPRLAANTESIQDDLEGLHEGNLFSFRLDQGDLLIWGGRKVFVDSRVGVYLPGGDDSILRLHDQARNAVRIPQQTVSQEEDEERGAWLGNRALWREIFDRFQVTQAAPRLWGRRADYETYSDLSSSDDWVLTKIGATMAVFVRTDGDDGDRSKFAEENRIDLAELAFRTRDDDVLNTVRTDWPRLASNYQRFLSLPVTPVSSDAERAQHFVAHLYAGMGGRLGLTDADALAAGTLAIRHANSALAREPSDIQAFRLLGNAYSLLRNFETGILSAYGMPPLSDQRHFQKVHATHQALLLEPENVGLLSALIEEYTMTNRADLALEMILRVLEVIRENPDPADEDLQLARRFSDIKDRVEPQLEELNARIKQIREEQPEVSRLQLAQILHQQGFSLRALEILEEDRTYISQDMMVQLEYALLLAQCGRLEDAEEQFATLQQIDDDPRTAPWMLQASWVSMARGDYDQAIVMCRKRLKSVEESSVRSTLATLPLVQPPAPLVMADIDWSLVRLQSGRHSMLELPEQTAMLRWTIITCYLESARNKEAENVLNELLDAHPETRLRPIAAKYLELISGKPVDVIPPSDRVPVLFAEDESPEGSD